LVGCRVLEQAQMKYNFCVMKQQEAEEIANTCKYDGIYSFYDQTNDLEDYKNFTDPKKRMDPHFSCFLKMN